MSRQRYSLHPLILIVFLLLAACSSPQKQKLPALLQQAELHNLAGVAAEGKGSLSVAELEFTEAYRLFASVENYQGMVTTLVNSSRLYRRLGNLEKSAITLKLAVSLIAQVPTLEAEICFEKSKLAGLQGDSVEALFWAERGVKSASDRDLARMLNLTALIHFQQGALKKAGEIAAAALKHGRSVHDRREEANALRLLGEIAAFEKNYAASEQYYESALVIDKELAIPGRVAADLTALSLAAETKGDFGKGAQYLQRAVDAEIADKNITAVAENLERLIMLYEKSGNSQSADKIRQFKINPW